MRGLFLISTLAIAASAVVAPTAEALTYRPITTGTVLDNCAGQLQFGGGAFGCTMCNDSGSKCTDYTCNLNPYQGPGGCNAVSFIVKRGRPSPRATPMQFWTPIWLNGNVTR